MTLEEAAKKLATMLREAEPENAERQLLSALRGAKLVAYQENLMAARFHAGSMGQGIEGLIAGLGRAIDSQEHELENG